MALVGIQMFLWFFVGYADATMAIASASPAVWMFPSPPVVWLGWSWRLDPPSCGAPFSTESVLGNTVHKTN
jgi:hypothetical protein